MTDPKTWSPVPLARGIRGAVVAPHHLATAAGSGVLQAGGTAVDAAIATNAVLGVVMPNGCGIGGDAFWLIWDQASGRQLALNGSGRAAAGASARALRAAGLGTIPLRGPHAITVPGAVRSWGEAHRRFGRLSRETVLAPAIELARAGFPAWDGFIDAVEATSPIVAATLGPAAGFFRVYRPAGRAWRPGERVRMPALAATLEALANDGFDAFYDGDLGERQARALSAIARRSGRPTWLPKPPTGASRSPSTTGVCGSPRTRPTARAWSPSRSCRSCASSRRRRRPRSDRRARPTPRGSISASRPPSWRWPTGTAT
ncbi:MAG: gamma-glutamyltransferase [Chloroflexi bacterium]|nr:gamma-glutamyltransferase [Chloroflexota bacterium]